MEAPDLAALSVHRLFYGVAAMSDHTPGSSRRVTLNGDERAVAAGTLSALLAELGIAEAAVVAELNGNIIPLDRFADTPLADGDCVELVRFVGGG